MPTIVFSEDWEDGLVGGDVVGNTSVVGSPVHGGANALRINTTAATGYWYKTAIGTTRNLVSQAYVRFATLPSADCAIFMGMANSIESGVGWNQATSQFAVIHGGVLSAPGGPTITTGTWYKLDLRYDTSANPWTIDGKVDGTSLTQRTDTLAAADLQYYGLSWLSQSVTGDVFWDDLNVSHTLADYPLDFGAASGPTVAWLKA